MKKLTFITLILSCGIMTQAFCRADFGIVDFKQCVEKSKPGQEEQKNFEELKQQMTNALEEADKELSDLAKKIDDQDYLDSLSPQAEEKLKERFSQLSQEFARTQNQYYQMINQVNYQMMQKLHSIVAEASENVRKEKDLEALFNQEAAFAFDSDLDYTNKVIAEMDKLFSKQQPKSKTASADLDMEE